MMRALTVPLLLPLGGQASWLLQRPQGLTVPDVATADRVVDIGVWFTQYALSTLHDVGKDEVDAGGGCCQVTHVGQVEAVAYYVAHAALYYSTTT
eukprot:scaffold102201_cov14-Prasinocladus_malaysianus.AAC.1